MSEDAPGRRAPWRLRAVPILAGLGVGSILLAASADLLHLGRQSGFGARQAIAFLLGLALLASAGIGALASRLPAGGRVDLRALARLYTTVAVLLLNVVVLFAVVEALAALGLRIAHVPPLPRAFGASVVAPLHHLSIMRAAVAIGGTPTDHLPVLALDAASLARIYPGWRREDVRALLDESFERPLRFDGVLQFREAPHSGRFVHVRAPGYREGAGGVAPWPPPAGAHVVWVLGGSTTFGYGLPDAETLPAQLERVLRQRHPGVDLRVYNFGQAYYYSVQELALLQELLRVAAPPQRVVFVDGINEHFARPFYSRWLGSMLDSPVRGWFREPSQGSLDGPAIVERWLRDKRQAEGICAAFGIRPLFVWQPTPDWGYDLRAHLVAQPRVQGARPVLGNSPPYATLDELRRREPARLGDDFFWLGDLQRGVTEPLYVDQLHYTARFTGVIAEQIATALEEQR